ncbi:YybS family protein [Virgibacillus xinjiangensis]|uniref:YybS family protein n=1 Tax=Virgibacillus xinjiangensis TaxID=393090 RepID=A0ABV7CXN2_9BACI
MNQSKKITDGAMLTGIFVLLLIITAFVPVLNILSIFLLPVPFIVYAARYSWKPGMLMFLAAVILSLLLATVFSLPVTVLMAIGGLMIGCAIYQGVSAYETLARGTLGFLAGLLFAFVFTQYVFQVNWLAELETMYMESLQMSTDLLGQFGSDEQTEEIQGMLEAQISYFIDLFPVVLVLSAVLLAFLSQWAGYKMINRIENKELRFPPFRHLQFPRSLIWVYLVAILLSMIELDPGSIYFMAVQNLLVLTGLIMAVQGISFVFFYSHQKKLSKAVPVLVVVLVILFPLMLLYFMRILGIIDIGFKLRERMTKDS